MCHIPRIFVIYLGVIRFTHLKTSVDFLYLTRSENESQFSLENISADGVKKAHCKIIRAALFRHFVKSIIMIYVASSPYSMYNISLTMA